jgi:hypothetical protein
MPIAPPSLPPPVFILVNGVMKQADSRGVIILAVHPDGSVS